jgi:hypothetical protein
MVGRRRDDSFSSMVSLADGNWRRRRQVAHLMVWRASSGPASSWIQRRWGGGGLIAAVHGDTTMVADGGVGWWTTA